MCKRVFANQFETRINVANLAGMKSFWKRFVMQAFMREILPPLWPLYVVTRWYYDAKAINTSFVSESRTLSFNAGHYLAYIDGITD